MQHKLIIEETIADLLYILHGSPWCCIRLKKRPLRYLQFWISRGPLGMGIVLDKSNLLHLGSYGQTKNYFGHNSVILCFRKKSILVTQQNWQVFFAITSRRSRFDLSKTILIPNGTLLIKKCQYLRGPLFLILCSTQETSVYMYTSNTRHTRGPSLHFDTSEFRTFFAKPHAKRIELECSDRIIFFK